MPRRNSREPSVEVRRHKGRDGVVREYPAVRYYDDAGVRRRVTFATMAEAELERARLVVEGERREAPEEGAITLGEFWPVWLKDARGRLEAATVEHYEYLWRRRLEPRFGGVKLRDIKPRAIAQWRGSMAEAGVGPETIRKSMVLLQAMITIAIEWGETSVNPVSAVRKPRQGRTRAIEVIEPLAVEQLRVSMLAADESFSAVLMAVLAYSGVRPAEALALERRHVRRDTLLIEQAVSGGRLKPQKTGRVYRTVDLLEPLSDDLAGWLKLRRILEPEAPLFPRADGGWWTKDDWDNWRNRRFHRFTKLHGIGRPRPYDLRHSFVSLLIREQRASIVDIADQLGHSPTETLKTYSHVMREYRRQKPLDATALILQAREREGGARIGAGPPSQRAA